jgi:asparaginyl-tRNA synthetase
MKVGAVGSLESAKSGEQCLVAGRVSSVRRHGSVSFVDVCDHTGKVQVVLEKGKHGDFDSLSDVKAGSYVVAGGKYINGGGRREINSDNFRVVAHAGLRLSPTPWEIDGIDPAHGRQVFGFPDFYLANPKRAAVLMVKSNFVSALHRYFQNNGFILVDPPILTDKTLYGDETAVRANVHGEDVFLSQCATFELEPLAMVFGKVYTISPAFRNERAGSKRHLAEYTHAKAEVMLADIEDLMLLAGDSISTALADTVAESQRELDLLGVEIDTELIKPGRHERMTYDDAIRIAKAKGSNTEYGSGLSRQDEIAVTEHAGNRYVWVQFPPFQSEGFPYSRKPGQRHLSMTCDLIAPNGAGEMVGVAEKTTDPEELIQNIFEKGMGRDIRRYWRYVLLRRYGMPPHGGMGAAPERIIYGHLGLDHIRLTKPWPRYPDRKINQPGDEPLNPWGDSVLGRLIEKYGIM